MTSTDTDHDGQPPFDVRGPLPTGTVVLEASAGTGKTFTIAALATRYVAEGVAELPRMMLVTFGRWATAELRDRVRARLVSAERLLRAPDPRAVDDELVAHLADVDPDELRRRRDRLTRAVAEFDAATIATTHGFCQQMLAGLGIIGDGDLDTVFVPDVEDLREEVVDDLYLQRYATVAAPPLTVDDARRLARTAVGDRQADLVPTDAAPGSVAAERLAFAAAVRAEVLRRKRSGQIQDYDDLLFQLRDALVHPVTGTHAVERVRSTYDVVLVDEFQDTDPVQWQILRTAFHGHRTLVLIGDPKQAIYAFRGADVTAYLDATRTAGTRATLARNHRSDEPLLAALEQVLAGVALGDDEIVVHPVRSAHPGRRLTGGAPLRLRVVPREVVDDPNPTAGGMPRVGPVRDLVAHDVAADVVRQLSGGTTLDEGGVRRPLAPGDVAVVTQTNAQAGAVLATLRAAGVPAVQSGFSSVFATPAADHWLTLLTALEQPTRSTLVGAAALTPFVGWTAEQLAQAGDRERDELAGLVRRWARLQAERGVAALLEVITADGLAARLLREPSGERTMTDVRHVGQTLHEAAVSGDLGAAATGEWLRARISEVGRDYVDERSRRLESDAAAVQVLTVHASKGLEFPVVHVPFGWDRWDNDRPDALLLHQGGRRLVDVGGRAGPGYAARKAQHDTEARDEDLRVLYVALTRARSQVVVWWAPSTTGSTSPLTRLLFAGTFPGTTPGQKVSVPSDSQAWSRATALAAGSGGTIEAERVGPRRDLVWRPAAAPAPELDVARFDRTLDTAWTRTSYTGLTRVVHDTGPAGPTAPAGVGSEPESAGTDDEVDVTSVPAGPSDRDDALPSPMADLPGGAAFGTLVHGVLEDVDTGAADLGAELRRLCRAATSVRVTGVDADALAAGLEPVLRTSLGPLAAGRTLAEIPGSDRLSEMAFELPLGGGDDVGRVASTLGVVASVLRHHVPPEDPLAGYAAVLEAEPLGPQLLRGYLTGSLDAVLRVPGPDGPRYVVADYKTNWLGPPDEPLTTWHYRPEALVPAMLEAHYPLQLLLYLVAVHRFLRWRQPGYAPDRHLGGGLYLFVRGMCGPATPEADGVPAGVFGWRPPSALVVELSAVLEGATARGTP